MQLQEFFDYKNQLMEDILTSEDIVHLINEEVDIEHAKSLAYTQVFPYEYLPETVEHGQTYVCFDVDLYSAENKTFFTPVLYIWVFTHKSKLHLSSGGVLTDKLAALITDKINGSRYYGLGELEIYSVKRFAPATDMNGKVLTFHTRDFNRPHPSNKSIPSNRKLGV